MIFSTLGSNSAGNGYYFKSISGQILILECGIPIKSFKKSIGFDLTNIKGALVSHVHGDHFGRAKEYMNHGIDVYLEQSNKMVFKSMNSHRLVPYTEKKTFRIGEFEILGFPLKHDVHTNGFLFRHPEMGTTVFITDTAYCEYKFPGLNNIILEANYSQEIMMNRWVEGDLNGMVRDRVFQSHMSFENSLGFLAANDLSNVNQIVLIHLSQGNADPDLFKDETEKQTLIRTEIALPGKIINLTKEIF